jgi:uncharacterized protein YkwD
VSRSIPLLATLLALALFPAAASACHGGRLPVEPHHLKRASKATLCLLNRVRTHHGLHRLHGNADLRHAATHHSRHMVRQHFFEHTAPNGSTMVARVRASGYLRAGIFWTVGENLGWGQGALGTPRAMLRAWMHSPPHRANILTPGFRDIGIGVVAGAPFGGSGATYTTDFGERR